MFRVDKDCDIGPWVGRVGLYRRMGFENPKGAPQVWDESLLVAFAAKRAHKQVRQAQGHASRRSVIPIGVNIYWGSKWSSSLKRRVIDIQQEKFLISF